MMGSSRLLEFLLALVIGVLAVLAALLCIGFLLMQPLRSPPSQNTISTALALSSPDCGEVVFVDTNLPDNCTLKGQSIVPIATCSRNNCSCEDEFSTASSCCCLAIFQDIVPDITCSDEVPKIFNTTACGCRPCDDVTVTVIITVVTSASREPVIAAQVFREEVSPVPIGITNTMGRFSYSVGVGRKTIKFTVRARGYMPGATDRITLKPNVALVETEVTLRASLIITIDDSSTPTSIELSPILSLFVPAQGFLNQDGEVHNGAVLYEGTAIESTDQDLPSFLPAENTLFVDENGVTQYFAIITGFIGSFTTIDNEVLSLTKSPTLGVFLPSINPDDLFLIEYDQENKTFVQGEKFTQVEPFRKKRQIGSSTTLPISPLSLNTLTAVAMLATLDCAVQARTFRENGSAITNIGVVLNQIRNDGVTLAIVAVSGSTGSLDDIVDNAICIPLGCDFVLSTTLRAQPFLPIEFSPGVFDASDEEDDVPVIIGDTFNFRTPIVANNSRPRPFYDSLAACVLTASPASSTVNSPINSTDFFSFENIQGIVPGPIADSCFVKVLVEDCFITSRITVDSVANGADISNTIVMEFIPTTTPVPVTEDPMTTMDGSADFTTDPETTPIDPETTPMVVTEPVTTAPGGQCTEAAATLRAACVQSSCGTLVRLRATSGTTTTNCRVAETAPLLSSVRNTEIQAEFIDIDASQLFDTDFNNPDLGLYYEPGNNMMAQEVAMQHCNAGGDAISENVDINVGVTARFLCYN